MQIWVDILTVQNEPYLKQHVGMLYKAEGHEFCWFTAEYNIVRLVAHTHKHWDDLWMNADLSL